MFGRKVPPPYTYKYVNGELNRVPDSPRGRPPLTPGSGSSNRSHSVGERSPRAGSGATRRPPGVASPSPSPSPSPRKSGVPPTTPRVITPRSSSPSPIVSPNFNKDHGGGYTPKMLESRSSRIFTEDTPKRSARSRTRSASPSTGVRRSVVTPRSLRGETGEQDHTTTLYRNGQIIQSERSVASAKNSVTKDEDIFKIEAEKRVENAVGRYLNRVVINEMCLKEIPKRLFAMQTLKDLNVSKNILTEIPKEIGKFIHLSKLDLHGNQLTALPEAIGNCVNLISLYADRNKIEDLPVSMKKLTKLMYLNLSENMLIDLPEKAIPHWKRIQVIDVSYNKLSMLSKHFGTLPHLRSFKIDNNPLMIPSHVDITNCTDVKNWLRVQETSAVDVNDIKHYVLRTKDVEKRLQKLTTLDSRIEDLLGSHFLESYRRQSARNLKELMGYEDLADIPAAAAAEETGNGHINGFGLPDGAVEDVPNETPEQRAVRLSKFLSDDPLPDDQHQVALSIIRESGNETSNVQVDGGSVTEEIANANEAYTPTSTKKPKNLASSPSSFHASKTPASKLRTFASPSPGPSVQSTHGSISMGIKSDAMSALIQENEELRGVNRMLTEAVAEQAAKTEAILNSYDNLKTEYTDFRESSEETTQGNMVESAKHAHLVKNLRGEVALLRKQLAIAAKQEFTDEEKVQMDKNLNLRSKKTNEVENALKSLVSKNKNDKNAAAAFENFKAYRENTDNAVNELQALLGELKKKYTDLTKDHEQAIQDAKVAVDAKKEIERKMADLIASANESTDGAVKRLQKSLDEQRHETRVISERFELYREHTEAVKADLRAQAAKAQLMLDQKLISANETSQGRITDSRQTHAAELQLFKEKEDLGREVTALTNRLAASEEESRVIHMKLRTTEDELAQAKSLHEDAIRLAAREAERIREELNAQKKLTSKLTDELQSRQKVVETDREQLEIQLRDRRQSRARMAEEVQALQKKLEVTMTTIDEDSEQKEEELEQQQALNRELCEKMERFQEEAHAEAEESEKRIFELKEIVAAKDIEIDMLKEQVGNDSKFADKNVDYIKDELQAYRSNTVLKDEMISSLKLQVERAYIDLDNERRKRREMENDRETARQGMINLEQKVTILNRIKANLESQLDTEVDSSKGFIGELRAMNKTYLDRATEAEEQVALLRDRVVQLESANPVPQSQRMTEVHRRTESLADLAWEVEQQEVIERHRKETMAAQLAAEFIEEGDEEETTEEERSRRRTSSNMSRRSTKK